jgi:hypothetical protein
MRNLAFVILAASFGGSAAADESPLTQCARVDDANARLACYDAVAGRSPAPAGAGGGLPATPAAPAVAPATPPDAEFGMRKVDGAMTAHIAGKFTEWRRGTLIKLDNGQVWRVLDDRSAVYPNAPDNAEVEITRGMFGYTMEIKTIGRRISVRRVS